MKSLRHRFEESRCGRFIRRYWWALPLWLLIKWGSIFGVAGYIALADSKEDKVESSQAKVLNVKAGDKLPAISLKAWMPGHEQEEDFNSESLLGKSAFALYFYPMDDTPGCTKEACALRDDFENLSGLGMAVIGVSADSHASHSAFAAKFGLPFALLVDEGGELRKLLGNPDGSGELIHRITYIVDKDGVVRAVIGGADVSVDDHVDGIKTWAAKLATENSQP